MGLVTSPPLLLPFNLGPFTAMGQGTQPLLNVMYSSDDFSEPTPAWIDVTGRVRSWSFSRGRSTELEAFEAGTATLELDNQDRLFDPSYASSIANVMDQVWIRAEFNGDMIDLFKGYVESIDLQWPAPGMSDALAVLKVADEFKVLALDAVPGMNPPRDTYADLVSFDNPTNYWRWSDSNLTSTTTVETVELPTIHWYMRGWESGFEWDTIDVSTTVVGFQDWTIVGGASFGSLHEESPIKGDLQGDGLGGWLGMSGSGPQSIVANSISTGDPMGGSLFTFETWFRKTGDPAGNTGFIFGPESNSGGDRTWFMTLNVAGTVSFTILDSGATNRAVTTTTVLNNDVWYHIVGELDDANLRIFVNGVQDATASSGTSVIRPTLSSGATMQITGISTVMNLDLDETACYSSTALPVARVLAHYQAGALRGYRGGSTLGLPHLRAGDVLDSVTNDAPRSLRTGTRKMHPTFQHGQDPLFELRKCALAEIPNGSLFVSKSGTITFLDAAHRSVSPWDTTQATFGDEGTAGQLPYLELDVDYSDAFIINEWNANRTGSTVITASDAASISRYGKRSQTLSDLPLTQDADVTTITAALLAKYKNQMLRVTSVTTDTSSIEVTDNLLRRELADRVRLIRTWPGAGLGWLDQTLYVQQIEMSGANDLKPWAIRFGVSDVTIVPAA